MNAQERAARYLARLPHAIAGQGGHAATFAAACRLVEFGLSESEAWPVLLDWNFTHCQPPWSEGQLRHKLSDAFRRARPRGSYVQRNPVTGRRSTKPAASHVRDAAKGSFEQPPAAEVAAAAPQGAAVFSLPQLRTGRRSHFAALAATRGLAAAAVALASERGVLRFGDYRGQAAWFVVDQSQKIAQARRLDGEPWLPNVKAWTLPGSRAAWPVGILEAAPFPVIALCEGGPDLLAAHHFMLLQQRTADCAAVAMMGAASRIHPEALPHFSGKRVRIFPHSDTAGAKAVRRWSEQLAACGAKVDAFSLDSLTRRDGEPVNDLNDLAQVSPEYFAANPCLNFLFP